MPGRKSKSEIVPKKSVPDRRSKLSRSDMEALDEFCSNVEIEEISFTKWQDFHNDLNLLIPYFLRQEEALAGCEKQISWVRSVVSDPKKKKETLIKQKVTHKFTFPPNTRDGYTIIVPDQGDQSGESVGIARIVVKISA
jgi:hypothetical protein